MIVAFKITDSFSHAKSFPAMLANCRHFAAEFPETLCEFFYDIQAKRAARWFFIKCATKESEKFVNAATVFAGNLMFEILTRDETLPLLSNTELTRFV